jgi:hypothetical protein
MDFVQPPPILPKLTQPTFPNLIETMSGDWLTVWGISSANGLRIFMVR